MSDLNVTRRVAPSSLPATSRSLTDVSAPSKSENKPEPQRAASQPHLFKSSAATVDPSSEAQSKIENTPSGILGQNQQLLQMSRDAIMQDAPAATEGVTLGPSLSAILSGGTASGGLDQKMAELKNYFKSDEVDITRSSEGSLVTNAHSLMMMSHNPLATAKAKEQSEFFRQYAKSEFSDENCKFYDKVYDLSKTSPQSPDFDQKISHIYHQHIDSEAPQQINISYANRQAMGRHYEVYQTAEQNYQADPSPANQVALEQARSQFISGLKEPLREIKGIMGDTLHRFERCSKDIHRLYDKSLLNFSAIQYREDNQKRKDDVKRNLKLYTEFKRAQTELKKTQADPQWPERQALRKAHRQEITRKIALASGSQPGTLKFALYNTFIRPWKAW